MADSLKRLRASSRSTPSTRPIEPPSKRTRANSKAIPVDSNFDTLANRRVSNNTRTRASSRIYGNPLLSVGRALAISDAVPGSTSNTSVPEVIVIDILEATPSTLHQSNNTTSSNSISTNNADANTNTNTNANANANANANTSDSMEDMDFPEEESASEPEELSDDEEFAKPRGRPSAKMNYQELMDELIFSAVDANKDYYDQLSIVEKMEHDYARKSLSEAQGIAVSSEGAYRSTFIPYKDFCNEHYSDPNKRLGEEPNLATDPIQSERFVPDPKRFEVNEKKVNFFMHFVIFKGHSNKTIAPHRYTTDKKIFFKRKEIEKSKVPITGEGVQGTFDLALYMEHLRKDSEKEEPLQVPYSRSK
ncbi:hypothetical protein BGX24_006248, partial [Mortierella sp. AD032]